MNKINILVKETLHTEYIENKNSIITISKMFKIAPSTVYNYLVKFDIPIRKSKKFQIPKEILVVEYIYNNKTMDEISEMFGCSRSVLSRLFQRYNIEIRIGKSPQTSILNKEILNKLYLEDDLTIDGVAKYLGFTGRYIAAKLKEFDIPRKRAEKHNLKADLTGKQLGRITVVSRYSVEDNTWNCICKCGNEKIIESRRLLIHGRLVKSCGCAPQKNIDWTVLPNYYFTNVISRAKKVQLEFNLTHKYLENLFINQNNKCALSGVDLCFSKSNERYLTTASLDRIDSSKGYIEGNVQWVHKKINKMKQDLENNDFICWCKLVAKEIK